MKKIEIIDFEIPTFIGNPPPPDLRLAAVFDVQIEQSRLRGLDLWKSTTGFHLSYPEGKKLDSPHYNEILRAAVEEYRLRTQAA